MDSCLVNRLSHYVDLTQRECDFIEKIEMDRQFVKKGDILHGPGDNIGIIHILNEGWACATGHTMTEKSHKFRVYLPGEVIGIAELGLSQAHHTIAMQTDGVLCPFPRSGLAEMLQDFPRLSALMLAISALDQVALREHAVTLAAMDAEGRLKHFLLQLRARLHVANVGLGNRIRVPFSQAELGELVGLTPIYVNRLLRRWVETGELSIDRPYFRLQNREKWEKELGFISPFDNMDTSWFPHT
ncbi:MULTISPECIES: Crp/Fnr family transcriptional regulator [unclassified Sulfitobacter]|jgi:CRP/FNR family transcriptional regulator|uniref:Crp/Fnr family transcriptional regulator n=1 Tax=unclassified Sulfitobacter TaxID=196795 RepID=UPI0007C358F0|nr:MULTISPECIES: Crp/Fnr family transcriptional regulator [unclassified Sulfitobacter]MAM25371.1 Crp/Fnr family transcriptional regulator [Paracoccaceae bacterium]KZX93764.1 cyclic nucleotide-binding protein [Sulfitobacter sp. HI0023]KZY27452.1 cyclic nucleotide-binding protein [Sulfitobacter sp. HI0040]KZZ70097.1 cyclic nucleotide-binding protein [Sulfitobacter sp. HI0129]MBO29547.1 Crp/Fnr family transcriptional regulator [Paracoccaceae bacterium]|tara:strand:+ start:790 stop:1518 length:729 start_codon:yes stop_codon:yes gene_type:complete